MYRWTFLLICVCAVLVVPAPDARAAVQAEYFSWTGFTAPVLPPGAPLEPYDDGAGNAMIQRGHLIEGNMYRDFDANPPTVANVGVDNFAVRWRAMLNVPTTGDWTFYVTSDDGIRLWVDQVYRTGQWIDRGATTDQVTVNLTAGQHDITVEYYERGGNAVAYVEWSGPGVGRQAIPAGNLSLPPENGLNGRYITNSTNPLDSPTVTRYDHRIEFPWGVFAPDNAVSAETFTAR